MRFSWFYNLSAIAIRGLTLAAKFLLVICLVQYFQPSELGLYGVMAAIVAYALFFLGLEFYNYTSRTLVGASEIEQVLIVRDQFILYALTFVLSAPAFYILFYLHLVPYSLCFWFFILIIFEHASNELMRILIALSRPYLANFIYFLRQGLWIYILLPVFYFFPASRYFNLIFIVWITGAAFSIFIGFTALYNLPWKSMWIHPVRWKTMWQGLKVSRPFLVTAFSALSLLYIERFFVSYYCGMEAVGIYTFYAGLSVTLHNLVNTGVSKMRLAQLLAAWKQNDRQLFHSEAMHMLKYTTAFVLVFSALSIALVYPFVNLINKSVYLANLPIFYFLLFGAACRSVADVPLYTLYAQHSDRLILLINLASFFIMVVGNAVLVPNYGLVGAALSSAGASLVLLGYAFVVMVQRTIRPFPLLQS